MNVPAPLRLSKYPSANNCAYALRTGMREILSSTASTREDGTRSPGAQIAADNFRPKTVVNLFVKRVRGFPVHGDDGGDCLRNLCHGLMLVAIAINRQVVNLADHSISIPT